MNQALMQHNSPTTLGDKINQLYHLRERKRLLKQQLDELNEEYESLEREIMGDLDAVGLQLGRGGIAQASITETTVPTVNDWEAFEEYVKNNDALYLFERRVSARSWRELYESGELVPGTEAYVRRRLNLRKL